jgi:hypothetical protein
MVRFFPSFGRVHGATQQTGQGGQVPNVQDLNAKESNTENGNLVAKKKVTALAWILGGAASIGGFIFGYESGQISGEALFAFS